jgi:RNA polymerase sigma-70 factor, ECF subfamily
METADAARGGRRHNLSLRQLAPLRARREQHSLDRAFETFYRKHVAEVYQYALAVLTNPADAEDVTQQTFINAYRAFERGERPHKPHNWLIKIAHNVCRMRWRQSSRRPQEVPLEHAREPTSSDEKPSLDEVLHALARLPFNQRAAIVMREVEDRSYAEIAEVLGTTIPAVEALLFRARTNLRARRQALGVLSVAPLPGSLSSFFGGGLVTAGGAALGSGFALKAAALVASGLVAGGLGSQAVKAVATPVPEAPQFQRAQHASAAWASQLWQLEQTAVRHVVRQSVAKFAHPARPAAPGGGRLARAPTNDRPSAGGATAAAPTATAPTQNSTSGSSPASSVVRDPASTVTQIVPSVPTPTSPASPVPLPPPPPLPSVTVTVPTVTVPTVTVPTVTVPAVPLPPLSKTG